MTSFSLKAQILQGCGRENCDNKNCGSNPGHDYPRCLANLPFPAGVGRMTEVEAGKRAVLALKSKVRGAVCFSNAILKITFSFRSIGSVIRLRLVPPRFANTCLLLIFYVCFLPGSP